MRPSDYEGETLRREPPHERPLPAFFCTEQEEAAAARELSGSGLQKGRLI